MVCRITGWIVAVAFVFAGAAPAFAQATTGTITGRAVDTSGAVLPGVAVSITSPQMIGGAREAVTDALGTYRFTQVPPGTYSVTFTLASFNTVTVEGVLVSIEDSEPDRYVVVPFDGLTSRPEGDDTDLQTTMTAEDLAALPDAELSAGATATTPAG